MLILALISFAIGQDISSNDRIGQLSGLRIENRPPDAVILKDQEQYGIVAFSFYKYGPAPSGRSWAWRVRREIRTGDESPKIAWTSQDSCTGVADSLIAIERISFPRVELRSAVPSGSQPPSMGPLHVTHRIWARAWDAENSPLEVTLSSLGSGVPQRIFERVDEALHDCWGPEN